MDLVEAHTHAADHRAEIEASTMCGCFYCCEAFKPGAVTRWVEGERTALCPRCGVDAVLGDAIGVAMKRPFLEKMQARWFSDARNMKAKG